MRASVRRLGIALGSLVAALLVVNLVVGVLFQAQAQGPLIPVAIVILGGLIYRDIIRREARSA